MMKRKSSYLHKKPKEGLNKKALIWIAAIFAVIVIWMTVMLIIGKK